MSVSTGSPCVAVLTSCLSVSCCNNNSNIIDDSFHAATQLIRTYGWHIVLTAFALYIAYPYIQVSVLSLWARAHHLAFRVHSLMFM